MSDYLELKGKRALVTGGTKGVGQAVVATLREAGAIVLTTARSQPERADPADQFVAADVSTAEGCAVVAHAVRERLGGIDIIVHVVGGSSAPAGGFAVLDDDEWHKALDQNLFAAVRLDRALLPSMIAQGSGVIIHITSIQRQMPLPDATIAYAAAKAALSNYSKALSKEVSPEGRARRSRLPRLGRDRRRGRPGRGDRAPEPHRLRRRPQDRDGLARRHSDRPPRQAAGSRGPGRVPRLPRAASITGTEYVIDGGTVPTA